MFNNVLLSSPPNGAFYENVKKYGAAREATEEEIIQCMRFAH
jgi:hypothetical protein